MGGDPNFENMLRDMADGIIDKVVDNLTTECAEVVFGEDDGEMFDGMVEDVESKDDSDWLGDGDEEMTGDEPAAPLPDVAMAAAALDGAGAATDVRRGGLDGMGSRWRTVRPAKETTSWILMKRRQIFNR